MEVAEGSVRVPAENSRGRLGSGAIGEDSIEENRTMVGGVNLPGESLEAGESDPNDVLKNANGIPEAIITLTQGHDGEGDGDSIGARVSGRHRSVLQAAMTARTELGNRRNSRFVKRVAYINSDLDVSRWSGLPRHLLILIIARLPFRNLLQARSLSNAWRLTFEQDAVFQAEVCRSASSWASYAPLWVDLEDRCLLGYESGSRTWHKLPTHWHVQAEHVDAVKLDIWSMDGSLCGMLGSRYRRSPSWPPFVISSRCLEVTSRTVFVFNLFTQRRRELPPPPVHNFPYFIHVVREVNRAYKVLYCSEMGAEVRGTRTFIAIDLQIFDSRDGSWSVESCTVNIEGKVWIDPQSETRYPQGEGYTSVVKDGFLYVLLNNHSKFTHSLVLFDLKERIFTAYNLRGRLYKGHYPSATLVVCGSDVLVVLKDYWESVSGRKRRLTIYRLELDPVRIVNVSTAPREMVDDICRQPEERYPCQQLTVASCNRDSIYVGSKREPCWISLCYNMTTKEWQFFNSAPRVYTGEKEYNHCEWKSMTYQPGLDPYLTP